jgi:hypothetical protein
MNRESEHPSRDELLVMAYVDDELVAEQRSAFQERLVDEPELLRQVTVYQKLAVMARQAAPPEPSDLEWGRIQGETMHQAGVGLGWTFMCLGLIGLLLVGFIAILQADIGTSLKAMLLAPWFGFGLLLVIRLRDRRRLIPFDPYTDLKR